MEWLGSKWEFLIERRKRGYKSEEKLEKIREN